MRSLISPPGQQLQISAYLFGGLEHGVKGERLDSSPSLSRPWCKRSVDIWESCVPELYTNSLIIENPHNETYTECSRLQINDMCRTILVENV